MIRLHLILLLLALFLYPAISFGADDPIDIGSHRELFVDRFLIDSIHGDARLELQHPHDEGAVLKFDAPWEGPFCAYVSVLHPAPDKYQMYYRGAAGDKNQVTCYAESIDGIHWTKPALALYPQAGSDKNNIVLADAGKVTHNFSPFIDSNPQAKPDECYKAIGGYDDTGLFAYASPDGIHWRRMCHSPVLVRSQVSKGFAFDSQNVPFWSEAEQKYLLYYRIYKDKMRRIGRVESDDFLSWRNPMLMEYRRGGQPVPIEQLYTNQTHPYFRAPQIYISTAARFMLGRRVVTTQQAEQIHVDPKYFNDVSDAIFMTSRGGNIYQREFMSAFVAPGIGPQNWISRTNYPALNVVQTGPTEMSIYLNQNYAQPTANLHRYSLRLDGFASIRAGYDGGEMVTKPLIFSGNKLFLNFSTSAAGAIKVELQDESGKSIPGFGIDDCQEIIGNEIERAVTWQNADLGALAGRPVRLRFVMNDANLFALRFAQ